MKKLLALVIVGLMVAPAFGGAIWYEDFTDGTLDSAGTWGQGVREGWQPGWTTMSWVTDVAARPGRPAGAGTSLYGVPAGTNAGFLYTPTSPIATGLTDDDVLFVRQLMVMEVRSDEWFDCGYAPFIVTDDTYTTDYAGWLLPAAWNNGNTNHQTIMDRKTPSNGADDNVGDQPALSPYDAGTPPVVDTAFKQLWMDPVKTLTSVYLHEPGNLTANTTVAIQGANLTRQAIFVDRYIDRD